ncbi:STAS domain-containing protein [Asanoa sp. WMMD1127]|uniref:STAS domain-containing protein n=1 Tax=Asanoa sp. WMMD1127 TaxID=3016107 RepID=UPI0024170F20|nr:STAS domain-containing protein [Asanoa sp. WMMD1127]MDG4821997.1 STAS domain-containing protein [Asanoa sp. WMMD1127]
MSRLVPDPTPLVVDVADGADAVVTVRGDLDFPCADVLRVALTTALDREPASLTIDVERLTFIDSTGLAVLVHAWRRGSEAGVPVSLRSVPSFLASILDITGVGELLSRPASAATSDAATA